jgi:hypothetical protein
LDDEKSYSGKKETKEQRDGESQYDNEECATEKSEEKKMIKKKGKENTKRKTLDEQQTSVQVMMDGQ